MNKIDLNGRCAVVTGGAQGFGRAITERFVASGARVAIWDHDQPFAEKTAKEIGGGVTAFKVDVSDPAAVEKARDATLAALGKIDILVNNAGTARTMAFETITDELWQEDLDLKLFAAIRFSRLVWAGMKQRKWGRIINVLNTGAKAPRPASAPTSVTRAAGMALTKVLAGEGAPHGILVNAMLVGLIESDQWVRRAKAMGQSLQDVLATMGKDIPLGRVGTAQEFANMACFLASDAASYITGTAINVDGGRSPVP
jgi:NAD(P)-dependent dehydrogenase (short-subunit alcohol dehydrogenase family)